LLLDHCSRVPTCTVLDLYSGNGNFSLPLAGGVSRVLGLESAEKSVASAFYNADVNGIRNVRYVCMDSRVGVEDLAKKPGQFDLVIMDPPRSGAEAVSRQLHKIGASQLIYISCDPMTLGRDLATLKNTGFEVSCVQPVDMFPQTYHLENVVFLKSR
jgi:23S rRNA (uracil1939-C5)-methyltransferase